MTRENPSPFSQLPATDRLLRDPAFSALLAQFGHAKLTDTLRQLQEAARAEIRASGALPAWADDLSLIHISEPTRQCCTSRMPSSA